jgi:hypothetical protein
MNNLYISLSALIVSLINTIYILLRNRNLSRLEITQEKMSLLTNIIQLNIEFQEQERLSLRLKKIISFYDLTQQDELISKELIELRKNICLTQEHYNELIKLNSFSKADWLEIKHRIEIMRLEVRKQTTSLENILSLRNWST